MPVFEVSAILCTHNPRPDVIVRTLDALKRQSLATDRWELLVVDSCSRPPLSERLDLSWHPHARLIEEGELGANAARLAAFRECRGQILVIVDDDNFLDSRYLETALNIEQRWPQLGAWGGSNEGEFESLLPEWVHGLLPELAIREVTKEMWTNIETEFRCLPFGAGMCVRRKVIDRYRADVAVNPLKQCLGRCGEYHVSGEDPDFACTAFDLGLGVGLFPELRMRHFMPSTRLKPDQLVQIIQGNHAGSILLKYLRGQIRRPHSRVLDYLRTLVQRTRMSASRRRVSIACARSEKAVLRAIDEFQRGKIGTSEEFRSSYLRHLKSNLSKSLLWDKSAG